MSDQRPSGHLEVDSELGVAYLTVRPGGKIAETVHADPEAVNIDVDEFHHVVGVEFMRWPTKQECGIQDSTDHVCDTCIYGVGTSLKVRDRNEIHCEPPVADSVDVRQIVTMLKSDGTDCPCHKPV